MAEGVWFIGDLSKMFIETITNVSLNVLQSELKTCQELLQLEPDNKCKILLLFTVVVYCCCLLLLFIVVVYCC